MGGVNSGGLFSGVYDYTPNATGLRDVPIKVWTTKSFTASWHATLEGTGQNPLFTAHLQQNGDSVTGTITYDSKLELKEPALLYQKRTFDLRPQEARDGQAKAGQQDRQEVRELKVAGKTSRDWLQDPDGPHRMKSVQFHNIVSTGDREQNDGFRHLDQSWRLQRAGQAILVARLADDKLKQESDNPAPPTRLWIGQLPDGKTKWQPPPGAISRETWIRVFIPVKTQ